MNKGQGLDKELKLGNTTITVISITRLATMLSRSSDTIRRYIREGYFPKPFIKINNYGYYPLFIVKDLVAIFETKPKNVPLTAVEKTELNVIFNKAAEIICHLKENQTNQ